uniref:ribosomal protein S20 n=1 Tax=Timspurckia oligopyrenoides TaxID=708627 RepID=UPI001FCDE774|nr:ribosomal protein S20 [Timspurckia oligopyrenoides]UNJ17600.1 ribosomal protein S20 [Timspurckia oligopyrenoides]
MNKKKSVLKRIRTNEQSRIYNKAHKSSIKTLMKRFMAEIGKINNESDNLKEIYSLMALNYSIIDKAVKRSVLHKNNGARKKALLAKALKSQLPQ